MMIERCDLVDIVNAHPNNLYIFSPKVKRARHSKMAASPTPGPARYHTPRHRTHPLPDANDISQSFPHIVFMSQRRQSARPAAGEADFFRRHHHTRVGQLTTLSACVNRAISVRRLPSISGDRRGVVAPIRSRGILTQITECVTWSRGTTGLRKPRPVTWEIFTRTEC